MRKRSPVEPVYSALGARIEELREARGLSQEALGAAVGISQSSVHQIESGRQRLSVHHLLAIAARLECDVSEMMRAVGPSQVVGRKWGAV